MSEMRTGMGSSGPARTSIPMSRSTPGSLRYEPGEAVLHQVRLYAGLSYYCDCFNEHYNSFQGSVKISAWQGWTMQGSYTYQRQWGDGWGYDTSYYPSTIGPAERATPACCRASSGLSLRPTRSRSAMAGSLGLASTRPWTTRWVDGRSAASPPTTAGSHSVQLWRTTVSGRPAERWPQQPAELGTGDPYAGAQGNRNQWFVGGIG